MSQAQTLLDKIRDAKGSFMLARVLLHAKLTPAEIKEHSDEATTIAKIRRAATELGIDPDLLQ